jgi:hypothetical protein
MIRRPVLQEVFMKAATLGLVCLLTLAGPSAQTAPRLSVRNSDVFTSEFTGQIMDSFCAEDGHHIAVNNSQMGISEVARCSCSMIRGLDTPINWMINKNLRHLPAAK